MSGLGIGAALTKARVGKGASLDEIARKTKIPARFLEAVEAEDFDRLPGLVFTRNFVRLYANELNLDSQPMLAALPKVDESRVQLPDPPREPRSRRWDSREKSLAITAAWMLALGAAGYGYYKYSDRISFRDLYARIQKSSPLGELTAHAAVPSARQTAGQRPPYQSPVPSSPNPEPVPAEASPATTPEESRIPEQPPAITNQPRPVQVVVKAVDTAWVSLTADGKSAFAGTLQANETKEISADQAVKLVTGNAGGVTVSLNGKTLDPLGPAGQVRVVRLTAEGLQFPSKDQHSQTGPL